MFFSRATKIFAIAIVAFVFATVATAFAASNTVPATSAGEGTGSISGYTVTNVQYHLNTTTPSNIDSVSFTLSASAGTVAIELLPSTTGYSCTNTGGNNWSCSTTSPQATVAPATQLDVIAAN